MATVTLPHTLTNGSTASAPDVNDNFVALQGAISATGSVDVSVGGALTVGGRSVSGSLRGRINADGTIAAGTGFTVNRTATGTYVITFSSAFSATPVIVATPVAGAQPVIATIGSEGTGSVTVYLTTSTSGSQANWPFHVRAESVA